MGELLTASFRLVAQGTAIEEEAPLVEIALCLEG
jgi:hypothetical protein